MAGPSILSLCAGIGGLDLAVRGAVPGSRTVCYVEREAYACAVLAARMADGALDPAPVWSDLRSFDGRPWRGRVDLVTAGYPCQPFSTAGNRRGESDPRHLWPDIRRILGEIRPRWIFCENVEGHLSLGFAEVLADLADIGFDATWDVFSAAGSGAPHLRRRLYWFAADSDGEGGAGWWKLEPSEGASHGGDPDSYGNGFGGSPQPNKRAQQPAEQPPRRNDALRLREPLPHADGDGSSQRQGERGDARQELAAVVGGDWWEAEPDVGRVVDGATSRLDRTRRHRIYALGNAVVPAVAARAFRVLTDRLKEQSNGRKH